MNVKRSAISLERARAFAVLLLVRRAAVGAEALSSELTDAERRAEQSVLSLVRIAQGTADSRRTSAGTHVTSIDAVSGYPHA